MREEDTAGGRGTGDAQGVLPFFTNVSSPRRSLSRGFGGCRMGTLLFSLPLAWRWPDSGLWGLATWSGHSSGIAPPGGVVGYA